MSLLPAYMSELWGCYEQMSREDLHSFDLQLLSVDPLTCHVSVLKFLAWEADVNINGFDENQARNLIKNTMLNSIYAGTVFSIKNVLKNISNIEIEEYFEEKPFYFKAKVSTETDIPSINKYAYLINKYKNARSHYELDFDITSNVDFIESSASKTAVDFFQDINFEKEFFVSFDAKSSFQTCFDVGIDFEQKSSYAASAISAFDIETKRDFFDVERFSSFTNTSAANMRLDFSYNDSDVMHLPIPPFVLNTEIRNEASAIFVMDFFQNSSDVFHLKHEKNYEVIGGVNVESYGVIDMEFYDSGVDFNTTTKTLTANAVQSVNLDI